MKRTLLIIAFAMCGLVLLNSCGDSVKVKKVLNTYLKEDAKTPDTKIVSIGEIKDFPFDFKDSEEIEFELKSAFDEATHHYEMAKIYRDGDDNESADAEVAAAKLLEPKVKELEDQLAAVPTVHYDFKTCEVMLKGKNALGVEITQPMVFYFDENFTVCSQKPEWLPCKIK